MSVTYWLCCFVDGAPSALPFGGVLGSVIVLLVIILVVIMNIWYPHVLKANSESARVSVFREGKSRTDTSKVILQLSCIYLQHDQWALHKIINSDQRVQRVPETPCSDG